MTGKQGFVLAYNSDVILFLRDAEKRELLVTIGITAGSTFFVRRPLR